MTKDDLKQLLAKYKAYLIIAVILVVLIVTLVRSCGSDSVEETVQEQTEEEEISGETEEEENKLVENSHASVDRIVTKFMDCIVEGDVETMETIVDYLSDEDKESITANAIAYESYSDLVCYTKDGPEEDSYIVYLFYNMKLTISDTLLPDCRCIYVSAKDEDGDRYIRYNNVENDEELQAYVAELEQDPEVQALIEDTNTRYLEALESDKTLYDFVQNVTGKLAEAEEEEPEESEETEEETSEEEVSEEETTEEASEVTAQNRETRVTETVNVRAETSTESERVALAYQGDAITQIESYDNGWSKVEYQGLTGYVMTEYLE